MERQLLIFSLLFLFTLSSCQYNQAPISNVDIQCGYGSLTDICVAENILVIEEVEPVAKNVWEYMIINNDYDQNIALDEKTLFFISNYLNNKNTIN